MMTVKVLCLFSICKFKEKCSATFWSRWSFKAVSTSVYYSVIPVQSYWPRLHSDLMSCIPVSSNPMMSSRFLLRAMLRALCTLLTPFCKRNSTMLAMVFQLFHNMQYSFPLKFLVTSIKDGFLDHCTPNCTLLNSPGKLPSRLTGRGSR